MSGGIKYDSGAKTSGWTLEVSGKLDVVEVKCLQGTYMRITIELI